MKTTFQMIPDSMGRIYCRKNNELVEWGVEFYDNNCRDCKYFAGFASGGDIEAVVECKFDNGSNKLIEVVKDNPRRLLKETKLVIKKGEIK
jgi:hypothetical protein